MAKFSWTKIDGLQLDLERYLSLPDEAVDAILEAEGNAITEAHKKQIQSIPLVNTGRARDSIKTSLKIGRHGGHYALVSPSGTHHTYAKGSKRASNSEVLFVHEYGTPKTGRIKASHWMRDANDKSAEAAAAAGQAAYDRYLESKNL